MFTVDLLLLLQEEIPRNFVGSGINSFGKLESFIIYRITSMGNSGLFCTQDVQGPKLNQPLQKKCSSGGSKIFCENKAGCSEIFQDKLRKIPLKIHRTSASSFTGYPVESFKSFLENFRKLLSKVSKSRLGKPKNFLWERLRNFVLSSVNFKKSQKTQNASKRRISQSFLRKFRERIKRVEWKPGKKREGNVLKHF